MSVRALLLPLFLSLVFPCSVLANVETVQLQAQKLQYNIQRNGVLDFKHLTHLSFRTSGFLQRLEVEEGDILAAGQEIARLDDTDLQANVNAAQASYRKASGDLIRARELYKKRTVSEDFLELAVRDERSAKTSLELAKYDIESAIISAPFDAAVVERLAQPGELLPAGNPAYQVAAIEDNYVVKLELTQDERPLVELGDTAQVYLEASSSAERQSVSAMVSKISARANTTTGMFAIELTIEQAVPIGFAGQWVDVNVEGRSEALVYAVPFAAVAKMKDLNVSVIEQKGDEYALLNTKPLYIDQDYFYIAADKKAINLVTSGWHLLDLQN